MHKKLCTMGYSTYQLLRVNTWPHVCEYMTMCMDTLPLACGYRTKWIQSHMHVDTQPHAHGYTATCEWTLGHIHMETQILDLIFIWFKDGSTMWAKGQNLNLCNGPIVLSQIPCCRPQQFSRSCPVVYIAKASSALWLKAQNDLKVEYISKFKVKFKYKQLWIMNPGNRWDRFMKKSEF